MSIVMKWKNRLIKALLWICNPSATRPEHPETPDKFLVVSTTGLGDTLWGTPAIRALRRSYPSATISVLTSPIGQQVLKSSPHIDELFTLNPSSPFLCLLRLLPKLRRKQYDAILIFHTSQRIVLPFCALLEAPALIGTEGLNKGLDFLLTKALPRVAQHEITRRLAIVKAVGAHTSDDSLEMPVRAEDERALARFLDRHGIPDHIPLVGLHPGAKDPFKQWPQEHFVEVGRRLTHRLGCQILVSGDEGQLPLALEIASQIPGAIPIAGTLSLAVLTALLKKMDLLITGDTGPMHLAFAANTPTVAIFGATDPSRCGPLHTKRVRVLSARKTCRPCLHKACKEPFCLLQIGPEAVYDAALSLQESLAYVLKNSWRH